MNNISKTSAYRHIDALAKIFKKKYPKWHLSIRKNSCWHDYGDFLITISNQSANYRFQQSDYLEVYINGSKLDFPKIIDNIVPKVLKRLQNIDLTKYRFINVINGRIDLYYKNFKTKKVSISIDGTETPPKTPLKKIKVIKKPIPLEAYQADKKVIIKTLEGNMTADVGDWIITDVNGNQYPVKNEIFKKTYDILK